jgi:DNA repair protein RadC
MNTNDNLILEQAAQIVASNFLSEGTLTIDAAYKAADFLTYKLATKPHEVFGVMFLDTQHQLIEFREMFNGTIDAAAVYPREVLKAVLELNASAVIISHNHPTGDSRPSKPDEKLTVKLALALKLIDVDLLDHIIVGRKPFSFANNGMLNNTDIMFRMLMS